METMADVRLYQLVTLRLVLRMLLILVKGTLPVGVVYWKVMLVFGFWEKNEIRRIMSMVGVPW